MGEQVANGNVVAAVMSRGFHLLQWSSQTLPSVI
jgi:hypothetical protein